MSYDGGKLTSQLLSHIKKLSLKIVNDEENCNFKIQTFLTALAISLQFVGNLWE